MDRSNLLNNTVSVIIPTFGANTDPCRAVKSVLNQDYACIQAIVVDDNGRNTEQQKRNQKSLSIYSSDDRFVYLVHDTNKGGSAARNTGVRGSAGSYLCFLDDDDEFTDISKVSKQIKASLELDNTWAGTYSSCEIYKGNSFVRKTIATKSGRILSDYMTDKIRIETACPIIRREAYDEINGFDESFIRHQDWEFFSRLFDRFLIKAVPEASYSRYYKLDAPRKSGNKRLEYMNKYASSMKENIKSLNAVELNNVLKEKYAAIIYVLLREKNYALAQKVMHENSFNAKDIFLLFIGALKYVYRRIRYGTHF